MAKRKPAPPAALLASYQAKRNFAATPEPRGEVSADGAGRGFVVQKHAATRLHYDLRLEMGGVYASWAVPRGPSYDPTDKRIAMRTEDHPLSYGSFEGTIPRGHYGAGTVIVWDRGEWLPVGDPQQGLAEGKLVFRLAGRKLAGLWELVRIQKAGEKQEPWILFKKRDEYARPHADFDVVRALPDSVVAKPLPPATRTAATPVVDDAAEPATAEPSALAGAVRAALPKSIAPQLATLASGLPAQGRWRFEVKFDGYRLMSRVADGKAALITRGGHDWTAKMPALAQALAALPVQSAWLDGEIVVPGDDNVPNFAALQNAIDRPKGARGEQGIVYYLFDLPYLDGHDLRGATLVQRRRLLHRLVERAASPLLRFSRDFDVDAATMLASAERMGLEGVLAKRDDAHYVSGRSQTWLKLKTRLRQEFVVCGYTPRSEGSPQIGSLLLGVHDDDGRLVSVGSVGTGWDAAEAARLLKLLQPLARKTPPFDGAPPKPGRWTQRAPGAERWVEPTRVAEVEFGGWTPEHQLRHAIYRGMRDDKPAAEVVREVARRLGPVAAAASAVKVTHPERVIDAASGLTKLDLVRYYEAIAPWMLPHLKARPASLVRAPDGVGGPQFFQKHDDKLSIPGLKLLPATLWPAHEPLLVVPDANALARAAQMNVIEFHTWNATARKIDHPDRIVFDLDPGEGTSWPHVREGALLVHTLLDALGLQSWLKTSGGKGLHVVVPLAPRADTAAVKAFSQAVVEHLARTIPARFVAKSGPKNRVGKIFVDYLRNSHGATTVVAYSARARPGLGVSMPIAWDALAALKRADAYTVANARDHLSFQTEDPWAGYWSCKQTLAAASKMLASPRRKA